ncbi:MAG: hypothetical protein M0Z66_16035 [Thermaerobacter sp.]|nr:hypothetical protein [Thermaerobacter sp.]
MARRKAELVLLPTGEKHPRPVTPAEELALRRSGTLRFKESGSLSSPAPDYTTREEYLQELAEGLTRIEGEARHLRATVERLRKTGGVRNGD